MEIHQFHIRPADFFTSNPALDMPGRKDETSVLVSCCGKNGNANANASQASLRTDSDNSTSVQANPVAHLQGPAADVYPDELPKGEDKRHSATLSRLFGWKREAK